MGPETLLEARAEIEYAVACKQQTLDVVLPASRCTTSPGLTSGPRARQSCHKRKKLTPVNVGIWGFRLRHGTFSRQALRRHSGTVCRYKRQSPLTFTIIGPTVNLILLTSEERKGLSKTGDYDADDRRNPEWYRHARCYLVEATSRGNVTSTDA